MTFPPKSCSIVRVRMWWWLRFFLTLGAAVVSGWLGVRLQEQVWPRSTLSEEGNILGDAAFGGARWSPARPEDLPFVPDSRLILPAKQKVTSAGWWYLGFYATSLTVPEVRSFYQKELSKDDWRTDTQLQKGLRGQENLLLFRRGINRLKIIILPSRNKRSGCSFWLSLEVISRPPVRRR